MTYEKDLGFLRGAQMMHRPAAFLQWKGTDACFDFHCPCGESSHFVRCPCGRVFEMPFMLYPREVTPASPTQPDPRYVSDLQPNGHEG